MTYLQYMYNGTVLRCNDTLHLEVFIYLVCTGMKRMSMMKSNDK